MLTFNFCVFMCILCHFFCIITDSKIKLCACDTTYIFVSKLDGGNRQKFKVSITAGIMLSQMVPCVGRSPTIIKLVAQDSFYCIYSPVSNYACVHCWLLKQTQKLDFGMHVPTDGQPFQSFFF